VKFIYSEADGLSIFRGMRNRKAVRESIGLSYLELPKTEFSENSTDAFGEAVLKAWYDASNNISGVQLYHPAAEFYFSGLQLLGIFMKDLAACLRVLGVEFEYDEDGTGLNIKSNTVRFYAPDFFDIGEVAVVEAVYIDIPKRNLN